MIELEHNLYLKTTKKVRCKDQNWNMPGEVILEPNTIVKIYGGPTRLSDVPFRIVEGKASWWPRSPSNLNSTKKEINSGNFFFLEGHHTRCPYDFGLLDSDLFELISNH